MSQWRLPIQMQNCVLHHRVKINSACAINHSKHRHTTLALSLIIFFTMPSFGTRDLTSTSVKSMNASPSISFSG